MSKAFFVISCVLFFNACMSTNSANTQAAAFVDMYVLEIAPSDGKGELVGKIWLSITEDGLVLMPKFSQALADGQHGFHIHEGNSVAPAENSEGKLIAGLAAKGHYDPKGSGKHEGPDGNGHLGDLPVLNIVDGKPVDEKLFARQILSLDDLYGRVLMIHANGDNYSDEPMALGGGGARYIAGIIQKSN